MSTSGGREPVNQIIDLANSDDLGLRRPSERGDGRDAEFVPGRTMLQRADRVMAKAASRLSSMRAAGLVLTGVVVTPAGLSYVAADLVGASEPFRACATAGGAAVGWLGASILAHAVARERASTLGDGDLEIQIAKRAETQRTVRATPQQHEASRKKPKHAKPSARHRNRRSGRGRRR